MIQLRKIALGAGAAALVAGASIGVTGMANATTVTPEPSASASAEPRVEGHGGGFDPAGLAEKLGVGESEVTDALQSLRDDARSGADENADAGTKPDREGMRPDIAASLAEALGLDEATVRTALDELRTEQQEERSAALQERLDAAVSDGSLTQAEADGAAKAVELGILRGGGPR
ncbi:hypothetical protein D6T63_03495 [Arthrobacter cheniae]|uniref:Uncharacterized protein n=1 Tax=Arthrobacter cheniae TaxID=1258888 RepID=A0A3A5MFV3_9MICC|nr:hypothetical protein [Arthrobacter cheniae]RJT81838.1 hypothetical protein D6T63_03495 [Arthrobacter cheniae]